MQNGEEIVVIPGVTATSTTDALDITPDTNGFVNGVFEITVAGNIIVDDDILDQQFTADASSVRDVDFLIP